MNSGGRRLDINGREVLYSADELSDGISSEAPVGESGRQNEETLPVVSCVPQRVCEEDPVPSGMVRWIRSRYGFMVWSDRPAVRSGIAKGKTELPIHDLVVTLLE